MLVTFPVGDECLRQITTVSPRIKLRDVSDLVRAERRRDFTSEEQFDALLAEAEVIYGLALPRNVIARAPQLKWVQVMSAGVDGFLDNEILQSPVIVTNMSGVNATPIGEFVLGLMLMFVKRAPSCFQLKQEKRWKRFNPAVLHSKTVGIVGLGSIGQEVARLAKSFGMRVVAIRRSVKGLAKAKYVDIMFHKEQLLQLLTESDFVVLSLPLTPETDRLIGEKELRAMKSTVYLINVSRGGIVDEEALIHALDEHWIAGAGLDVFANEPLPADSRLWKLPNVILSPHVAGLMEDYNIRANEVFCENLRRYLDGKKLLNVISKKKRY
ncbi:D-2-hydroxyacid dehydrogenase [Chloroflexota bacterium]